MSDIYLQHLMTIIISVFLRGYRGKTVDFSIVSQHHRTTVAYFLNHGKWNDSALQKALKSSIVELIYQEARSSGQPVFCIVDDTIASHVKPSSQALHPIEAAYFHQSHLKGRQDYGHQVVSVMLSCNGITLNYAVILYDKTKSKIKIVQDIATELPEAPVISYFLCDSWYTKQNLVCIVNEYPNLDLIGNARIDSVMYDLAPAHTGRRGRPAKHGKRLSVETDFTFSNEKIGDYYTGVRRVLAKIFGNREVLAYVTATEKEHGTKRLFFSTIFPEDLQIFCAWQEKAPLNQTGSE